MPSSVSCRMWHTDLAFNKDNSVVIEQLLQVIISSEASVWRLLLHTIQWAVSFNVNTNTLACKNVFLQFWVIDINVVHFINFMKYSWFIWIDKFNITKGAYCEMFQEVAFACGYFVDCVFPKDKHHGLFHQLSCSQLCIKSCHCV